MSINDPRFRLGLIAVGAFFLGAFIFFWVGWGSRAQPDTQREQELAKRYLRLIRSSRSFEASAVPPLVETQRLRESLRYLSSEPHIAGQPGHDRTAKYFKEQLGALEGFEVTSKKYYVALGSSKESKFQIVYKNGTTIDSQVQEKVLSTHENKTGQVYPILSFTPGGDVTGRVVYANYGRETDFEYLRDELNLTLTGTIALIRYGSVGRGKKLVNAHAYGCVGGIVFSDPANAWAQPGKTQADNVYPNTWWLPPTGVQRGSAKMRQADPLTPHYPSLDFIYRDTVDELKNMEDPRILSPIPGYPVGYGDATLLLERLGGQNVSDDRQGGIGLTYRAGGEFVDDQIDYVRLVTTNQIDERVEAENVFAVMKGDLEPDRYMLVGNHRDAWGTGAVDATSGSTTVLELARTLSKLYANGWRPRRSIMLCSWDAEEQGIMGSWEWVEDKFPQIKDKVVAYLNIDIAVRGNYTIRPNGDPMMQEAILQTLRNVPVVQSETKHASKFQRSEVSAQRTMYDEYKELWLDTNRTMSVPLSGSDYSAFIQMAGVPIIDVSFVADPKVSGYYPLYHSTYETFYAMENFIDPGFIAHRKVTIWATEVVRMFADTWLLPYNETALVKSVKEMYESTKPVDQWGWPAGRDSYKLTANNAWNAFSETIKRLEKRVADIQSDVSDLQRRIDNQDESIDPMLVRSLNDRRMRSMQALTDHRGQPRNPTLHNLFYASSSEEAKVQMTKIPGLSDLLALAAKDPNNELRWKAVAQHASALAFRVQSLEYQLNDAL